MNQPLSKSKGKSGAMNSNDYDAVVIGAGFGGMYALHRLRKMGLSVVCYEGAAGVGGTWWWNRYPGARVDFPSAPFYSYSFSEELIKGFDWKERQPAQEEVLSYLNYVADELDLKRDIRLSTWIKSAVYNESLQSWTIETGEGESVSTQFLVCAVGTLSSANKPSIPGIDDFAGECYHTGRWPSEKVEFSGKRVGVIGTGSSGIQSIPVIAKEAAHLSVFQRTPQYSIPAGNRPVDKQEQKEVQENWPKYKKMMEVSAMGMPYPVSERKALDDTEEDRDALYEELWQDGGLHMLFNAYSDLLTDEAANETLGKFVRKKIREIVKDSDIADKLMPNYLLATKRQVIDDGYYESFNRDNVELVDLREGAIEKITETGVITANGEYPLDMLVLATGFDAITGALLNINPVGKDGVDLKSRWNERFETYLGLTVPGFPNLFMVHGPQSPSVLFNMPYGGERGSDWIADCIGWLRDRGLGAIEPAPGVEVEWAENIDAAAKRTLFAGTDSWYSGANIPGKHRQFIVHTDGLEYYERLKTVAEKGYEGFETEGHKESIASAG